MGCSVSLAWVALAVARAARLPGPWSGRRGNWSEDIWAWVIAIYVRVRMIWGWRIDDALRI